MNALGRAAAALVSAAVLPAQSPPPGFPSYSSASIVHGATGASGPLAPGGLIVIYGTNLAAAARAAGPGDLPTELGGSRVLLRRGAVGEPAPLYYVSPTQINAVIPGGLGPGAYELAVAWESRQGPAIPVTVQDAAPGLFARGDSGFALATHPSGELAAPERPAAPGGVVILYGAGFGAVTPPLAAARGAVTPAPLVRPGLRIWLAGEPLPREAVLYAGAAIGFPALHQINLRLPDTAPADPEVRVGWDAPESPAGLRLSVRPSGGNEPQLTAPASR